MSASEAAAPSPAKSAEGGGAGGEAPDAELPRALLKRILKARLSEWDAANGGDGTRDFQINKDALLACAEAAKLFIHYLSASANDVCRDAKRQTISADDVATALEDIEWGELVEPLKAALEAYKAETKEKARKKTEAAAASKKRKAAAGGGGGGDAAADGEQQQQAEAMDAS